MSFDWLRMSGQKITDKRLRFFPSAVPSVRSRASAQGKLGETMVKFSGRDECYYGKLYAKEKERIWEANLCGELSSAAAAALKEKNFKKTTVSYKWYSGTYHPKAVREWRLLDASQRAAKQPETSHRRHGVPMLPPMHVHNRARRYRSRRFHRGWRHP